MNTTKQFLTKADYASPLCKTIAVNVNTVLCGSELGEPGDAGANGSYENPSSTCF